MVNEKILVVEDEELVAQDIKAFLEDLGYKVLDPVPSGEEAVEKVGITNPDSILMDVVLEGEMDGIEASQQITDSFDIPIVYLTAYGNEEIFQRAKKTEPYGYILKPFRERELQINIEMALYKHAAEKKRIKYLKQKTLNGYRKKSLEEKEALLKEIEHRVKNNMQIIISLLYLQSRYFDDEKVLDSFTESINRVKTMAMIHEIVYQSENLSSIDFSQYLPKLVSRLLSSYGIGPNIETNINAKDISMNIETAIPCGLIINELVTNALKHAFPHQKKGKVNIEIYLDKKGTFTLIVSDDGVGLPREIELQKREALGLKLVDTLTKQLNATIKVDGGPGTCFKIKFKELEYKERI
ncbi:MAG: response regulator [Euryarchaeota archaeon]|nr:response regulator [Euryarchaeota archaeon]